MKAIIEDDEHNKNATRIGSCGGWMASMPACVRSDSCGKWDDDERVRDVALYAAGMARGSGYYEPALVFERIKELHDHEGWLSVILWRPIPRSLEQCFREAWGVIGHESGENVEFCLHGSPEAQKR